jgi:hypothetical protein
MFRKQQEREMLIDTIDNVFESGFSQKEGFSFFFRLFLHLQSQRSKKKQNLKECDGNWC